jgi:N-acetylmuramoyl-L-alanine amidase
MKNGKAVLLFAKLYLGFAYVFGAFVPKNSENYKGAFDCAEFVAFCIFKVYGFLYGCSTSDVSKAAKADAYTGFFDRDALQKGIKISVEEATRTPGSILLRVPQSGAIGHVVFSNGDGTTTEAHSTKMGVIYSVVTGRRWSYGILLPGVEYTANPKISTKAPAIVYRWMSPLMTGDFVGTIQLALIKAGFDPKGHDQKFGEDTHKAVVAFQKAKGLIADGEVMPNGETAKALKIN